MTTDTFAKVASASTGAATVVGIAKGVGMIEPDMATLIALFVTDASIESAALDAMFRRVIDRTLNAVSIDTDTSTSDTAAIMASGVAGEVDVADLEAAAPQRRAVVDQADRSRRRRRDEAPHSDGRRCA